MKVYHYNHIGKRKRQEDALAISEDNNLFVLCDGVGGSEDGSLASRYACDTIIELYNTHLVSNLDDLRSIVIKMSESLNQATDKYVATTLTILCFHLDLAYLVHLGDSRIYYFNANEKELKRTKDHSLVRELYDAGILNSEEEMRSHPLKNKITRSLNSNEVLISRDIDCRIIDNLSAGDKFLLCSDGVTEVFDDVMFKDMFMTKENFNDLGESIKIKTNMYSKDNNSAILLEL